MALLVSAIEVGRDHEADIGGWARSLAVSLWSLYLLALFSEELLIDDWNVGNIASFLKRNLEMLMNFGGTCCPRREVDQ